MDPEPAHTDVPRQVDDAGPPRAVRRDVVRELHGDTRVDGFAWLHDVDRPEAIDHLTAERAYYDASTAKLRPLAERLAAAMTARTLPVDSSPPTRRERYAYLSRTPAGSEYEQLCRIALSEAVDASHGADSPGLEVLLDGAELAGGSAYFDLGVCLLSPDERLLAYSVDTTGDEVYALRFRDLESGADLADGVSRTYFGGAWSADSGTYFYPVHDDKYRPNEIRRHRLGTPPEDDELVIREDDERFSLELRGCRSGDVIEVVSYSRDTTEVWLLDTHHPEAPARCVEPRRAGVDYRVEHARTPAGDRLFVTTNDGAVEYRLMSAPLDDPGRSSWVEELAEDPGERLYEATAFAGHVVTTLRRDGLLTARAYRIDGDGTLISPGVDLTTDVELSTLELEGNERYDADHATVRVESHTRPAAWYDIDLRTGDRTTLMSREVPDYDPLAYTSELIVAPPLDGAGPGIPVTVVRRTDTPLDGTAPCLLYGYGAYEAVFEPAFDPAVTVLLDRGVVFANAHVRGGGEGGRRWWLDGRLEHKQNTFSDHIAVANHLAAGIVDGTRIVTRGLSAGGLLQGAVFSQAPQRWAGVIAEVPFVDVVTTMLDASIPLTVNEWDEWGDPRRAADYAWMRAYSPYDNLPAAGHRPDLFVTGALHDARVMVFEPAKWVAALRESDPAWSARCVFRVELGEGAHAGPSGRFARLRYEAELYAWVLERFGLAGA